MHAGHRHAADSTDQGGEQGRRRRGVRGGSGGDRSRRRRSRRHGTVRQTCQPGRRSSRDWRGRAHRVPRAARWRGNDPTAEHSAGLSSPASRSRQWCTVAIDHTTEAESSGTGSASAVLGRSGLPRTGGRVSRRATRSITGAGSTPTLAPRRPRAGRRPRDRSRRRPRRRRARWRSAGRRGRRRRRGRRPCSARRRARRGRRTRGSRRGGWGRNSVGFGHRPTLTVEPNFKSSGNVPDGFSPSARSPNGPASPLRPSATTNGAACSSPTPASRDSAAIATRRSAGWSSSACSKTPASPSTTSAASSTPPASPSGRPSPAGGSRCSTSEITRLNRARDLPRRRAALPLRPPGNRLQDHGHRDRPPPRRVGNRSHATAGSSATGCRKERARSRR